MEHEENQTSSTANTEVLDAAQSASSAAKIVAVVGTLFSLAVFFSLQPSGLSQSLLLLVLGLAVTGTASIYLMRLSRTLKALEASVSQKTEDIHAIMARAETLAVTDSRTGLFNRPYFEDVMANECRRAVREFTPLTLMLITVDYFKNYSETYGPEEAENGMVRIVDQLKQSVSRPGDLAARYEDEVLAFLLPSTNEQVVQLAERCCDEVRKLAIPHSASAAADTVTVSIGVATMQPSRLLTPERLIGATEQTLLEAKKRGGNQYVASAESVSDIPSATYSI